jgi:hypothetical protein
MRCVVHDLVASCCTYEPGRRPLAASLVGLLSEPERLERARDADEAVVWSEAVSEADVTLKSVADGAPIRAVGSDGRRATAIRVTASRLAPQEPLHERLPRPSPPVQPSMMEQPLSGTAARRRSALDDCTATESVE